jgi:hypothetical protein
MVLLLVALIEDVAHSLLLLHMVVVLQHAHLVKLDLSEEGLLLARFPGVLGL